MISDRALRARQMAETVSWPPTLGPLLTELADEVEWLRTAEQMAARLAEALRIAQRVIEGEWGEVLPYDATPDLAAYDEWVR